MNSSPINRRFFTLLLFSLSLLLFSCEQKTETTDKGGEDTAGTYDVATTDCLCESSWFPHSQTPPPAEGVGSPFDTSSTTNCIFQQWSWQKFLYLTKPQENGQPLFLNEMFYVTDNMTPVDPVDGVKLVLTLDEQAGTNGILTTNPGFSAEAPDGKTVYYSIHMDPKMFAAGNIFAEAIAAGTIPQDNDSTFPIGSLEMKAAWVEVDAIPNSEQSNYFTTQAVISEGAANNKTDVALMGIHVVGRVINHPEFIWATFEHNSMGPVFDWTSETADASDQELVFKEGSTSTIDGITWTGSAPETADEAYTLYDLGVPRDSGGGYLSTSQTEPENYDNIVEINDCVAENLNDVWNNYFFKGAVWINTDGLTPQEQADTIVALQGNIGDLAPGTILRGSVGSANLSMETYAQTFASSLQDITTSNIFNCFTCHTAKNDVVTGVSPLYLSHIFNGNLGIRNGLDGGEIERKKIASFVDLVATKSADN